MYIELSHVANESVLLGPDGKENELGRVAM